VTTWLTKNQEGAKPNGLRALYSIRATFIVVARDAIRLTSLNRDVRSNSTVINEQ
jgi:hypothetical protein